MAERIKSRNETLDLLKVIAAYSIIFGHYKLYGALGTAINALNRFTVPLFFLTSGYFCYQNDIASIRRKTLKILRIFLFTSALYIVFWVSMFTLRRNFTELKAYLYSVFNPQSLLRLVLFNRTSATPHTWFLPALIYAYLLQCLAIKLRISHKILGVYGVIALLLNVILGEGLSIAGVHLPESYTRNFLLMGYPYFVFGLLMRENEQKVIKTHTVLLCASVLFGVAETIISRFRFGNQEMYLGTIFIIIPLVIWALRLGDKKYPKIIVTMNRFSLDIYIYHMIIARCIMVALKGIGIAENTPLFINLIPILTLVFMTILAFMLDYYRQSKKHAVKA